MVDNCSLLLLLLMPVLLLLPILPETLKVFVIGVLFLEEEHGGGKALLQAEVVATRLFFSKPRRALIPPVPPLPGFAPTFSVPG